MREKGIISSGCKKAAQPVAGAEVSVRTAKMLIFSATT
jgi:hypothetical protein